MRRDFRYRWAAVAVLALAILCGSVAAADDSPSARLSANPAGQLATEAPNPVDLSDDAVMYLSALREHVGLSSNPTFVRDLYARPAAYGAVRGPAGSADFAGLVVTPDEAQAMKRRASIESAADVVSTAIKGAVGVDYQATWIDSSAGAASTVIHINVSANAEAAIAAARATRGDVQVVVHPTSHSGVRLRGLAQRVAARLGRADSRLWGNTGIPGVNWMEIDGLANLIVVEATNDAAGDAVRAALATDFAGEPVRIAPAVSRQPSGYPLCGDGNWKCDWNWLYSGLELYQSLGLPCTTNIAVRYAGGTTPALLTAGHCLPSFITYEWDHDRYSQGNYLWQTYVDANQFGWPVARESFNGTNTHNDGLILDAGLIYNSVEASRPGIGRGHFSVYAPAGPLTGVVNTYVGQSVCQNGWASTGHDGLRYQSENVRCGWVYSIGYAADQYGQLWPRTAYSNHATQLGDSGSLVYGAGGGGTAAIGITSGIINDAGNGCWNGWTWVPGLDPSYYPCRNTFFSPLVTTMAVWGLTFQGG